MKKALQSAIMLLLAFAVSASASAAPCAAGQRWLFGGKEREHAGGRNSYDYGARNLIPAGCWSSPDPLAHKFYSLSPFSYCGGDPINYVDPNGKWSIKVSASSDRLQHPYAILSVYDRNWKTVYRTAVRVKGKYIERNRAFGDTPQGRYKLIEWRQTGIGNYKKDSFGPNYILATLYEGDEGKGRSGMHIHGGRQQGPELTNTEGCIRISNEDIIDLHIITEILEQNDSEERMEYMEVTDDLEEPVHYQDRDTIKNDLPIYGGILPELIVTLNSN